MDLRTFWRSSVSGIAWAKGGNEGGQKVMEAGGDSDLSLFTNRVPAKYLPRILVPKKGKWSGHAWHVVDNG